MTDLPFTLDQLRILKAIASEGSFKKAAESLIYLSQQSVYKFKIWKEQLSVPIFDRENQKSCIYRGRKGFTQVWQSNTIPCVMKVVGL